MQCIKKQKMINRSLDTIKIFPCGKCLPCVVTRRQEWTLRLLLEARTSLLTYYLTLTYSNQDLPPEGELHKPDLQDFCKRLRKNSQLAFRYFAAGEYGEKKDRPHYHLVIFTDREFKIKIGKNNKGQDVVTDSDFHQAWYASSFVDVVPIIGDKSRRHIFGYIAGYVLKKLGLSASTHKQKEFILTSRGTQKNQPQGGLGAAYAKIIAKRILSHGIGLPGVDGVDFTTDIHMIRVDKKLYPLGRFMRQKIYAALGGDNRTQWVKETAQNHKAIDELQQADLIAELETESQANAAKAYKKYLKNRKL